ncbi:MAG: class I SAM-dependent methyltransferase [bacterium]|nr:class I SAM-dependent methyltransferase [bacterium]
MAIDILDTKQGKVSYWDQRAREYGHSRRGYKAICSYGSPYLYNKYIDLVQKKGFYRMLKAAGIQSKSVLDIGCGVGRWCRILTRRGAVVTGADLSSEMVRFARENTRNKVIFITAPAAEITLPDASFDLITSVTVLQHITDTIEFKKTVANLVRLIKPGGKLLILEVAPSALLVNAPFSAILKVRSEAEYLDLFAAAGARLVDSFAVDVFPLKQWLILHSKQMPGYLYHILLHLALLVTIPIDFLLSGTRLFRQYSWHKAMIFKVE